jgi:endonuclease-3
MDKKIVTSIIDKLSGTFSDKPALNFNTPYELLIAVILSAQCTDERVNKITAELFKEYNTPQKMLTLNEAQLEKYIFSCGLYHSKARNILKTSLDLVEKFNGQVPKTLEELRSLAGVGRKTANVVYSVAFGGQAIAVDTHVFRVSNRIGLAKAKDVLNTEKQLMKAIDKKDWSRSHHYLIYLGRSFCKAGKPDCENCPIKLECKKIIKKK